MFESRDDDEKYLEDFKRLVTYEEFCKDKESFGIDELENEILIPRNDSLKTTHKHLKSKGRGLKFESKTKKTGNRSDISSEEKEECKRSKKNIKMASEEQKLERKILRSEILSKLSSCYIKDINYDSLMNKLIDLEESFIQS